MMQISKVGTAADEIARARLGGRRLAPLHPFLRPADEAAAYQVQAALHQRLEPTLGRRIGYKIGCTTPVMQAYLGIPSPCSAGVFEGGVHKSGVTLRFDDFRHVGVECEIAVRLGRDLPAGDAPFTAEGVRDAVAATMAAIEIVDDRYEDWRTTDPPTLIADDFFAAGCVLGAPVSDAGDHAALVGVTTINGVEVGRGIGADVMGHPLNALAWIAASLAGRGTPLRAGEIVLLGSLVETKWLARGDHVAIAIDGLGRVEMRVE
jgi:2-keto-4-pentenoate hydratase